MPTPFEEDILTFVPPTDFRTIDPETGMRVLHVHAYFAEDVEVDCVYREDWLATGIYQVLIPANLPDDVAAMCAFTTFHHVIPIKCPWTIDVTVREPNGKLVALDGEIEEGEPLVEISGSVTKLLPAKHLACRPGWQLANWQEAFKLR